MTAPLLDVRDLKLYYSAEGGGQVHAVDGVTFSMNEGEVLGVVGESGCGKTSLGLAIARVIPGSTAVYAGAINLEGEELMNLPEDDFRRRIRWKKVALVFQGAQNSLNPVLKVGFQIAEPMLVNGATKGEAEKRARELLTRVGLPEETYRRYPHQLSGGMKQRVAIAMALVLNPRLLILDEPTSALDVSVQAQLMNLLKNLKRELSLSAILITHDIAVASDICDRFAVLYAGQVVESGGADDLLLRPGHPYTQRLLASIPSLKGNVVPEFIPGAPPDLVEPRPGCRFRPRCPRAFEPCGTDPPVFQISDDHDCRCWLYRDPP